MRDPRLIEFIRLFNSQAFFESHEVLEDLWLETKGRRRLFYKGLIQCAVALAHYQRKNLRGARQVGARSITILKTFNSEEEGIKVVRLIHDCEKFLGAPDSNFPQIRTNFDRSLESQ